MIAKFILLTCLVVVICEAGVVHHYKEPMLDEICVGPDATKCKESAQKCFPTNAHPAAANWKQEYCKTFEGCLDQVAGTRATYATFIKEKRDGKDWCATSSEEHPGPEHHEKKEYFKDFLTNKSGAEVASTFTCCISKGKGKFNADGKVNVAAWKKIGEHIEDAAAKKAYEAGVDSCAASHPACSVHDFKLCAIKKCYESIKGAH